LVNHKSVLVNGKKVNIPSYQVAEGDEISISEKSRHQKRISQSFEIFKTREPCEWIEVNHDKFLGIYKNTPNRDSLSSEINESFIVELYSR
jgi:small subunit ribosomal protein S4